MTAVDKINTIESSYDMKTDYAVLRFRNGELTLPGAIYDILCENNCIKTDDLAKMLGTTISGVSKAIMKLKAIGRVKIVGGDKTPNPGRGRPCNVYETFSYEQIHQDRTGRQSDASSVP